MTTTATTNKTTKLISDAEWEEASEQHSINYYESGAYLEADSNHHDCDELYKFVCQYFKVNEVEVVDCGS